ncbi:MAG TPA: RcnB family protein [Rhizomicrobium sp.]|jgi:Ni/Co efflux regulator RcnB|nr:RcnB family protein [Rhizomicrobium sp.]
MKSLIVPAALALCLGATAAVAQTDSTKTTTTQANPDGSMDKTTTTTTQSSDGYATYRKTVTSKKHYDAAAFQAPSGYTYSRFSVGQRVPHELIGMQLNDYQNYALVTPPSGLVWIRNGRDALLVDGNTGEVIQADNDLFD